MKFGFAIVDKHGWAGTIIRWDPIPHPEPETEAAMLMSNPALCRLVEWLSEAKLMARDRDDFFKLEYVRHQPI